MCFMCPTVLGVLGGIYNMLETNLMYSGDPGQA
jgi:hypothetical protein